MRILLCLLALGKLISPVLGESPEEVCLDGIRTDLYKFTFAGGSAADYWGNICQNTLSVHSMWAAAKVYCTESEIEVGGSVLAGYCEEYGMVKLTLYSEVLPNLTNAYIAALPTVQFTDIDESKVWDHAILLSKQFFQEGIDTVATFEKEYNLHKVYGWGVYGFWAGIVFIGAVTRLTSYIFQSRSVPQGSDTDDAGAPSSNGKRYLPSVLEPLIHWTRTNLTVPALFGSHHQRLLWGCTIPTRFESVIVIAYWILNFVLCCVTYEIIWPNLYYTTSQQGWRYVADRTGILCYANLPILWAFSGRNNIFLWVTGWSFSAFNVFHRNIARIVLVQAVVHAICYTVLEAEEGALAESWTENYWYMGGIAVISMGFLTASSVSWFRKHTYELFLLVHIVFSVLVIVGLFYHTAIFEGEWDPYLWPLVAIWSFDRFARIVRLAYCNLHVAFSGGLASTKTIATYNQEGNFIRLEVFPGSGHLKPGPGQHYFIYQMLKLKGWENHPFTLAAWEVLSTDSGTSSGSSQESLELPSPIIPKTDTFLPSEIQSPTSVAVGHGLSQNNSVASRKSGKQYKLTFLVRPFSSWTKRLKDECLKPSTATIDPKVLIEGPYGEGSDIHTYENVVLIAGGTGIAGVIPYLQDYVSRKNDQRTKTRDITVIWTTRQKAMISDIAIHELQPYLDRPDMQFSFHATGRQAVTTESKESEDESLTTPVESFAVSHNRPNITEMIHDAVAKVYEEGSANNQIAVLTCGPGGMADEARAAVHKALKQGRRGVGYMEEAFGY